MILWLYVAAFVFASWKSIGDGWYATLDNFVLKVTRTFDMWGVEHMFCLIICYYLIWGGERGVLELERDILVYVETRILLWPYIKLIPRSHK